MRSTSTAATQLSRTQVSVRERAAGPAAGADVLMAGVNGVVPAGGAAVAADDGRAATLEVAAVTRRAGKAGGVAVISPLLWPGGMVEAAAAGDGHARDRRR